MSEGLTVSFVALTLEFALVASSSFFGLPSGKPGGTLLARELPFVEVRFVGPFASTSLSLCSV